MELKECRALLDGIDRQMAELFEKRMGLSEEVARVKLENGMSVLDREREKAKLESVRAMAHTPFNAVALEELYRHIMSISRKRQYGMMEEEGIRGKLPFQEIGGIEKEGARAVFQGTEGAYSQEALLAFFGEGVKASPVETFRDAMSIIDEGAADYAVLPIENSSAGIVSQNYDLLVQYENYIVAEQVIPIRHCLLGLPGASEEDIKNVYSHPQALMQCGEYLEGHRQILAHPLENTAVAARLVRDRQDRTAAAIASRHCASLYGLEVLREDLNTNAENSTRFIIVTNQKVFVKGAGKVSICFELPHESGSLYHVLSHFYYNGLNMNRIESRPIPGRPWEYRFFIDFEGNLSEGAVRNALHALREETVNMKILGNY
ncbi:MAG: prephenate dehydratase [Lachnospiraceae bacterium]|nr:prephenate dehydratase [Lachnospiraceae bacterium]